MEHITRCPACEIAFHVTDDQLQLAAGKVRCGACLTIFDARSYIESHIEETDSDNREEELLIHDGMDPETLAEEESEPAPEQAPENTLEPEPAEPLQLPPKPAVPALEYEPSDSAEPVITLGCDSDGSIIELGCDTSDTMPSPETAPNDAIADEPLFTPPVRKRRYRPLTAVACLLALLLLPAQYIYFHFEQLAQDPKYHRWLTTSCKLIGCQVPPLMDLDKISSTKLLVVDHPQQPQALLVEAILENRADFPQPFPSLLLMFQDLQGTAIAQRHFQPGEYLHGEMDGSTLFPPHRPVHIRLELADPGPKATNYQLLVTE